MTLGVKAGGFSWQLLACTSFMTTCKSSSRRPTPLPSLAPAFIYIDRPRHPHIIKTRIDIFTKTFLEFSLA